jgi:hypothetical protein
MTTSQDPFSAAPNVWDLFNKKTMNTRKVLTFFPALVKRVNRPLLKRAAGEPVVK